MTTITLKLPDTLRRRLEFAARKRGRSKSQIVRESLEQVLMDPKNGKGLSCYDLVADLIEPCRGPSDLSTNPKYMKCLGR